MADSDPCLLTSIHAASLQRCSLEAERRRAPCAGAQELFEHPMATDGHRQRGRILIVDDESNARAALSEILREDGYATETAADGFKALGKLEEFAPDVILTDLKMPGLDGIALMEKARIAAPGTVFVVMTAFGTISSAVEAMKKGAEN